MNCKKYILLFVFSITFIISVHSQLVYYVDALADIYTYDISTCENTFVVHIQGPVTTYSDITFAPDGNLYVVSLNQLYRINLITGARTLMTTWTVNGNSLTSDSEGNIYMAGNDLSVYNIYNQSSITLGSLPAGLGSSGDLTFRNDSLLLASGGKIVFVDIENPSNSSIYFDYSANVTLLGISTFFINCDSIVSFGSNLNQFFLIDYNNQTIAPTGCTTPTTVYGMATLDEWQTTDCELSIDLDGDDSSSLLGPMPEDGFYQVACQSGIWPIVDTDMVIVSDYFIDSVTVEVLPHPNSDQDFLDIFGPIQGVNYSYPMLDQKMLLSNGGSATAADFEEALKNMFLTQIAPYAPGLWQIQIIIWANNGTVSDTALSQILFLPGPQVFSLGEDTTLCNAAVLELALPPNLSYQIDTFTFGTATWQDGSHGSTFTVTAPGAYFAGFTWEEAPGCTWSDTIEVSFADTVLTESALTLCQGDTFFFNGQAFSADTVLCATTAGFLGCDSTHCTSVFFLPASMTTLDTTICQGQSVAFGGQQIGTAGIFADTLTGANGCDSILLLDLAVLPADTSQLDTAICQGSAVTLGGQVFSLPGVYHVPFTAQSGCDSVVELHLSVNPLDTTLLDVAVCEGGSFAVGGVSFSDEGLHEVLLTSQLTGCDSLVLLDLTVTQAVQAQIDTAICQGETIVFAGQTLGQPGVYADTLTAAGGCDSIVVLNLGMLPLPTVAVQVEADSCGGPAQLTALATAVGFLWSNGGTQAAVQAAQTGSYSVTVTDANGCTGKADTAVVITPLLTAGLVETNPTCHDSDDGFIEIMDVQGGTGPYSFLLGGVLSGTPIFGPLPAGDYAVAVQDGNGCGWPAVASLQAPPPFVLEAGDDQTIAPGQPVLLSATASSPAGSVWWLPADYLGCASCLETSAAPAGDITYQVFALDANGCLATDTVAVFVEAPPEVYAPNAFSPNGDGVNDFFTLYSGEGFSQIIELNIFDRWGGLVFKAQNIPLGSGPQGWDGTRRGEPAGQGVYTWFAQVQAADGSTVFLEGGVHLLR